MQLCKIVLFHIQIQQMALKSFFSRQEIGGLIGLTSQNIPLLFCSYASSRFILLNALRQSSSSSTQSIAPCFHLLRQIPCMSSKSSSISSCSSVDPFGTSTTSLCPFSIGMNSLGTCQHTSFHFDASKQASKQSA